jgi:Na+/proline symporter
MVGSLQTLLLFTISIVIFVAAVWALIQAFRFPADAYVAAGKRTRTFWLAITGGATLLSFLGLPPNFGFGMGFLFWTAAAAGALIFFVDVLPRLREVHRPGQSRPRDNNRGGW